eukprot:CAMPEP_0182517842 /NCGR_PEP_ID=MMETSP1321-20130603/43042_1 /TAXON_ID=91990 /ORGANISM="Bolidomonas sp., Strain RCC1657" /LENGTH=110 /DNA_ID=CAMNT_0024725623 /DNA_START=109 /DNA_END=442 /DNA_ORIENTATION=+
MIGTSSVMSDNAAKAPRLLSTILVPTPSSSKTSSPPLVKSISNATSNTPMTAFATAAFLAEEESTCKGLSFLAASAIPSSCSLIDLNFECSLRNIARSIAMKDIEEAERM